MSDDIQIPSDWLAPPPADPLAVAARELRGQRSLRESPRNSFMLQNRLFAKLIAASGKEKARAELMTLSGLDTETFPLGTPAEQRRFIDEARRRLGKLADD
ncbi:hypothetical protein [Derxia gummosa]|uniref:Uncharacterized protein n=1 Tax=Derxia gummosa DSM 723 TaxID=1121388 RepID=A0A8B6X4G7_9BURK|nr:hypothetical protein [Derxia gummosa]